ncbi:MAG: hypothetical protein ACTJH9_08930 [Pseudoalteromonas sp.]|uniref:hypothetical protein n=1 Tax=unclassified Pseudoalteromonas TaxID=194690 RepID=UPI003F97EE60
MVACSTLNTEQKAAEQLANKITEQVTIANQASGASDCLPILPIQTLCISNPCQSFNLK